MKEQILKNIHSLYRSHMVTAMIFLGLIILAIIVTVGVVKFDVVKTTLGKVTLIITVIICSTFLVISQIVTISPIYKDYRDSSYTVVEDATMIINGDSTGVLDRLSTVLVETQNEEYKLIMRTYLKLNIDTEYVCDIAFLKHSKYIVWYHFK